MMGGSTVLEKGGGEDLGGGGGGFWGGGELCEWDRQHEGRNPSQNLLAVRLRVWTTKVQEPRRKRLPARHCLKSVCPAATK